jgi:selenide,water dikinase
MQGPELQIAFAVNGRLDRGPMLGKGGAQPGDRLLLTKPLGTGALFAAHMLGRADGRDIEGALAMMERSNAPAAEQARRFGAHALTDITGFGLAGHLLEMLGSDLGARVEIDALPVLPGTQAAMAAGVFSTLHAPNREAVAAECVLPPNPLAEVIFDPQTSGGLLMALPAADAEVAREALLATGASAVLIGEICAARPGSDPRLQVL